MSLVTCFIMWVLIFCPFSVVAVVGSPCTPVGKYCSGCRTISNRGIL